MLTLSLKTVFNPSANETCLNYVAYSSFYQAVKCDFTMNTCCTFVKLIENTAIN